MKNLHLVATDKPSRLYFNHIKGFEKYQCSKEPFINGFTNTSNYHIYITNNSDIKKGDWVYSEARDTLFKVKSKAETTAGTILIEDDAIMTLEINEADCKKIIMTTNQDLIADGVQKIDDDFLEWFINNPSCEEVKVESNYRVKSGTIQEHSDGKAGYEYYEYKIIIPIEEPKQELLENDEFCHYSGLPSPTAYKEDMNPFELPNVLPDDVFNKSLEELAKKEYPKLIVENPSCNGYNEPKHIDINEEFRNAFIEGAEYMQEQENLRLKHTKALLDNCEKCLEKSIKQMYSEEDMIKFAEYVTSYPDKNRNHNGEILHAKSKYDEAERKIDLLEIWLKEFKTK